VSRDVRLFYCYRVISRLYFHLPVLFLHLYNVEMGLYNVIVLLAVYGLITTVTSNLGSTLMPYMRQKDLVASGEMLKVVGLAVLINGTSLGGVNFWEVLIAQIIGGCGFSLAISMDAGVLRNITASGGNELFTRVQTKSQSMMFIATLVAGSLGSILYDYHVHWPFYASMCVSLTSSLLVFMVHEEKKPAPPKKASAPGAAGGGKPKLQLDASQTFWMNFYSLSRAFTLAPFIGILPFYFIELQVDPYLFGSVLGLFTMAGFITALYSNAFLKRFGLSALLAATLVSMVGSMLLFGFSEWFSLHGIDYFLIGLVAIGLLGLGSGGVRPVTMGNINLAALPPEQRPRLLGTMERNFGVYNGILLFIGGYLLAEHGFQATMLILCVIYVLVIGVLFSTASSSVAQPAEG